MQPTSKIQQHINSFFNKYACHTNISAIHVRRTDLEKTLQSRHVATTSDEDFFAFINTRLLHHEKVFLMTDNRDTQVKYSKKYKDKIIILNTIVSTDCSHGGMRCTTLAQTVTEMYITIHAVEFMGTNRSSLSDTIKILRNNNTLSQSMCSNHIPTLMPSHSNVVSLSNSSHESTSQPTTSIKNLNHTKDIRSSNSSTTRHAFI